MTNTALLIDSVSARGSQDAILTSYFEMEDGLRLRSIVRADSNDFQSYAVIEMLDVPGGRSPLASIHFSNMASAGRGSYADASLLIEDENELLRLAGLILP